MHFLDKSIQLFFEIWEFLLFFYLCSSFFEKMLVNFDQNLTLQFVNIANEGLHLVVDDWCQLFLTKNSTWVKTGFDWTLISWIIFLDKSISSCTFVFDPINEWNTIMNYLYQSLVLKRINHANGACPWTGSKSPWHTVCKTYSLSCFSSSIWPDHMRYFFVLMRETVFEILVLLLIDF
jgi:hypothetical protein